MLDYSGPQPPCACHTRPPARSLLTSPAPQYTQDTRAPPPPSRVAPARAPAPASLLSGQPLGSLHGVVGQDEVRARPAQARGQRAGGSSDASSDSSAQRSPATSRRHGPLHQQTLPTNHPKCPPPATQAPHLRKHMSASRAASFSFSQPRSAAALSMAYSPLTWYTLTGRVVLSRSWRTCRA